MSLFSARIRNFPRPGRGFLLRRTMKIRHSLKSVKAAPQGQPHRAPQGPRLRHQQDQPALQGAPGLSAGRVFAIQSGGGLGFRRFFIWRMSEACRCRRSIPPFSPAGREIVAALRAIVPGEGVIDDLDGMRPYECDALSAYRQMPLVVVLPETVAQVSAILRYCQDNKVKVVPRGAGTSLSGGSMPVGDAILLGHGQVQPRARDRLRQPLRPGAARRHQPRHLQGGRARGLLLRARSQLADRLLDRRQRRGELGRRALPEVRPHHQQPSGHRDGADDRRGRAPGRQASRFRRLRPDGPDDRLRRAPGRRHRGDGAAAAQAVDGARRAAGLSDRSGRRGMRGGRHRLGHHPRRHGDDGQGRREVRRGLCRRGLSAWTPRPC